MMSNEVVTSWWQIHLNLEEGGNEKSRITVIVDGFFFSFYLNIHLSVRCSVSSITLVCDTRSISLFYEVD